MVTIFFFFFFFFFFLINLLEVPHHEQCKIKSTWLGVFWTKPSLDGREPKKKVRERVCAREVNSRETKETKLYYARSKNNKTLGGRVDGARIVFFFIFLLLLSFSHSLTHTHTHTVKYRPTWK